MFDNVGAEYAAIGRLCSVAKELESVPLYHWQRCLPASFYALIGRIDPEAVKVVGH